MFNGKLNRPAQKIGNNLLWTLAEVESASWAISRRSANLSALPVTEDTIGVLGDSDELEELLEVVNETGNVLVNNI